jgi:EAL and modified HD-GYP domain-containing signal transduction protein
MLALDDYVGQEGYGPLLDLADIVKVDLLGRGSPEIIGLTQDLQTRGCTLLAEKVEDEFSYALARALGYQLFQGYHFARPMNVEGRTLSPNRAAKLLLLKELADPDYSVKRVARTIATDLSLSYRLIRYLNSASLSVRERVSSVEQAVSMLGGGPLRQWLSIVMITEMNASQRASALLLSGVQRARFLECLCGDLAAPPSPPETMFLLGLFSNLDAILNMPMQEITSDLPLEQDMLDALNGRPTRPRQWIDLALHLERGEWGEAGKVLARHKLDPKRAALHHSKAGAWAGRLLECAREDHAAGVPNSRREAQ